MYCEKCGNQIKGEAKFCTSCGAEPKGKDKPQLGEADRKKLLKNLKNAGNSVFAIGWVWLVLSILLLVWHWSSGILQELSEFVEIGVSDLVIQILISIVFIILGRRIKDNFDVYTVRYLNILFILVAVTVVSNLIINQRLAWISLLIGFYLLAARRSIRRAEETASIKALMTRPEYKIRRRGWIIFGVIGFFAIVAGFFIDVAMYEDYIYEEGLEAAYTEDYDKGDVINEMVATMKSELSLPTQIDEVTTLTNVSAQPDAVRYHYKITGVNVAEIGGSKHRAELISNACADSDTRLILDGGINFEYSYETSPSNVKIVTIKGSDCI